MTTYLFAPPPVASLPVRGRAERFPVERLFFVGRNYHAHAIEMELVVAIGAPGFRVAAEDAHRLVFGYACGLDMTRRDLQLAARDKGRPWDLGKDVEESSVCGEIVPMPGVILEHSEIALRIGAPA